MNRRRGLIGLLMLLGLVATACGTAATPIPLATTVPFVETKISPTEAPTKGPEARKVLLETTESLKFSPSMIRVEPGESIEFIITDTSGFAHTLTIAASKAKRKILQDVTLVGDETKSVQVTFPEETGTLYLFCRPHEWAGMIGTIGVGVGPDDPNDSSSDYRY